MGKGRKAVPNQLKSLRGTDQPCRTNYQEPEYERITKVSVPRILSTPRSKKIYRERAQVLINMKLLQEPDQDLLVAYANTLDLYYRAIEQMEGRDLLVTVITNNGSSKKISPYLQLQSQLLDIINKLSGHFGFSPASRASLRLSAPQERMSEFEKLLHGKE